MSDWTPATEEIRTGWMISGPPASTVIRALQFERWLEQVKAEAWDEGFDSGQDDAFHLDTHPAHTCIPNPYQQKETDA